MGKMVSMMTRRGPDDEGRWSDGKYCALGFRRLSILDLSKRGGQPMVTSDGRYALVYNGELYNYQDIRAQLEAENVRFNSSGDTEVVLQALVRWGEDALPRFNGMFALALYDAKQNVLLLARDHAGIKPLYYYHHNGEVCFASQMDQVLAFAKTRKTAISNRGLALYLNLGYVPPPDTLLENVFMLEAGAWLRFELRNPAKKGIYFDFPSRQDNPCSREETLEALESALPRAVKRHMVSDVEVGVFLSGGIDSPLVAAEASKQSGARLKAFTLGFDYPGQKDESEMAARFAAALGVEHHVEILNDDAAARLVVDVMEACGEPTCDYSIIPALMLSKVAAEHVKVVLSGDGGDELFWGYPERFLAATEQAGYFRFPKILRKMLIAFRHALPGAYFPTREVLAPSLGDLYRRKHTIATGNVFQYFKNVPEVSVFPETKYFHCAASRRDDAAFWSRWNEFEVHLGRILLKMDRASMFHSLEVRTPLLDKEIIDAACRTDWKNCLDARKRIGKLPLRQLLDSRIGFQAAEKKGFSFPMERWLLGPLKKWIEEYLIDRKDFLGFEVDSGAVTRMLENARRGDARDTWSLWSLLSLALWERKYWLGA